MPADIIRGDGPAVLATLEGVDLVLTDPPYNAAAGHAREHTTPATLRRRDGSRREVKQRLEWDRGFDPGRLTGAAAAALRPGGSLITFSGEAGLPALLEGAGRLGLRSFLYWLKANPAPSFGRRYMRQVEFAVWMTKGKGWTFNGGGTRGDVYESAVVPPSRRRQPTEKPESVLAQIIETHTNPGGLVVDPFAGSGSTLVAAARTGRRAVGVEIDPVYCRVAADRLRQRVLVS